jgi:hypothetical protein
VGIGLADTKHSSLIFVAPSSRKKKPCVLLPSFPVNSSTSRVQHLESSDRVKRLMYRIDKFLGVSHEGFEHEISDLFSAIESSRKGYKGTSGSFKKERGRGVKVVRELLNLSCSMNYDSKRNPSKPCILLVLCQAFYYFSYE